ncbi:prolyl-tRNA editing enzyme YbaK/EbsC (Cys-tRNA(Pro) deacylase) [Mesorhizobium soli]|uniref:YbaK/EbsC family protein n=1 Tax=Pseudaminobacter soli (ex Li et al. 2025) TaxID=1295366 RepID=UPI002476BA43|nr:YbaK/EbsC family protein [Mesorhizobium soli]MDH6234666.1 prolyl-tRNA editing enzyme YbaK/EbsC (Cys-tRNA(Pro) deacylase) [Mesorhizobium soli]
MAGSIDRVTEAAAAAGLQIEIVRMGASTRTAEEAAAQCGCTVAQIVKSLIFQGESSGKLYLFLVSGPNQLDLAKAAALVSESLKRADPRHIRDETGFAIGGVSPIGHLKDIPAFADESLLSFDTVWAAAGAHDAVFAAEPKALLAAARAKAANLAV